MGKIVSVYLRLIGSWQSVSIQSLQAPQSTVESKHTVLLKTYPCS